MTSEQQHATRLDALEAELATVGELVTELSSTVQDLATEASVRRERACWWPDLDQTQAADAWQRLGDWVYRCLLPRHPAYTHHVRACWRLHPNVIDELTALRVTWIDAYQNPRSRPTAAVEYLGRWLPEAMARIERAFVATGCEPGPRSTHHDSATGPPPAWTEHQLATFLDADLEHRPAPAAT